MNDILNKAIQSVQQSEIAFCKYITANDTGATGGHQAGYHIHKKSWKLFFDQPGIKGTNKDRFITIRWQDSFETESRFIYYGVGTRDEYRLTRYGKAFPFLRDENIGDLLVICKITSDNYQAFVLNCDDDIEEFLAALNISSTNINGIIPKQFQQTAEDKLIDCFTAFLKSLKLDFPTTIELANNARNCYNNSYGITSKIIQARPDVELLKWIDSEFQLFKVIENDRYTSRIQSHFKTVEELVITANTILNRRKSRAGKSLEHHLSEIFNTFNLAYTSQQITEGNKKPDFLFPTGESYHNPKFDEKKLIMLASKTTCKDRWRQILNEADRIKTKHLFTLQQGISSNQLKEMYQHNVCLVVPKPYLDSFPKPFRERILTLDNFINFVRYTQSQ
ncbi:type II restriction endonuclease [Flavobacterium suzhouense]|uniref:Type II restriction endonuclease n=1 Tax=Flavobacterium suzhouense TaxID=1529638 RepID=A0ABW5NUP0_9FLAO